MAPPSDTARARLWASALSLLLPLGAALLATACVLQDGSWPHNHEGLSHLERTEWFRRAFAVGDWWPTWTPFSFNGHGSPGPFFYHRLYYAVAGALALLTGSTPLGALLTLLGFLVLGGVGMVRVGQELQWPRAVGLACAVLLILAPYTFTNWLVRAAMAELAAAMLLPWLLLSCFRLVRGERVAVGLGVVYGLLFYAHVVIWLYAALVLLCFALAALLAQRRRLVAEGWRAPVVQSLLGAGALTVLIAGVQALAIQRLGGHFSLGQFGIFHPTHHFQPPLRYLWDDGYTWGRTSLAQSLEVGRWLLLCVALLLPLALRVRARVDWWRLGPLLALLGLCALLQLEVSAPFYRHVPLAGLLQFPWRLLTLLTVGVVVVLGELAASVVREGRGRTARAAAGLVACAVAFQVAFALHAQRIRYPRYSADFISAHLAKLDGPWSAGEYLVRGMSKRRVPPPAPFLKLVECHLMQRSPDRDLSEAFHFTRIELVVVSEGRCVVHFSQFVSPLIRVDGVEQQAVRRSRQGTYEVALGPGVHRLAFERQGVLEALLATP